MSSVCWEVASERRRRHIMYGRGQWRGGIVLSWRDLGQAKDGGSRNKEKSGRVASRHLGWTADERMPTIFWPTWGTIH